MIFILEYAKKSTVHRSIFLDCTDTEKTRKIKNYFTQTDFYSYNDTAGDYQMENFSIERDKRLLLPLVLESVRRQKDMQTFASPWCPPLWLKTKPAYNDGVFEKTPKNYQAYALYFKKYVQAYRKQGVPLVHICPQNEPCSNQIFPSCVWTGSELTEFIGKYLGPTLKEEGVDIIFGTINGPETDGRYLWTKYDDYLGFAMKDQDARKYIKGVGYQWAGKYALAQTQDDYPDLEIIQTESECGDGQNSFEQALYIFSLMRQYFRFGASSYVYWNLALKKGEPSTWGWYQNSLITVGNGEYEFTPEFYVMKHFSHFIKRGAKAIAVKGELSSCCCAFKNPDGERVLVVYNPYGFEQVIAVEEKSYILPPRSINTIV